MINVKLLRRTLEHITTHQDQHDQNVWWTQDECGTSGCLAGWACALAGRSMRRGVDVINIASGANIPDTARELLGLRESQAGALFDPDNRLCQLWELAADYTDGAIDATTGLDSCTCTLCVRARRRDSELV